MTPSELPPTERSDADLLAATAGGDSRSFDAFVLRHAAHVHRFLASLRVLDDDADDALQDTFVAAWRGAGSYRAEGSARAWLFTIARNAVRRIARRRTHEPVSFQPLDTADTLDALALAAGWGSGADSAARDTEQLVREALVRLGAGDREILVLRDIEGLSGEEAAAALGLSLAAMKSRLHRARLRLAGVVRSLEAPRDDGAAAIPFPSDRHVSPEPPGAPHA